MSDSALPMRAVIHYFVDEAGDPRPFDAKGRMVVGFEGCSKYFIVGKISDLHLLHEGKRGVLWGLHQPLSLSGRAAASAKKEAGDIGPKGGANRSRGVEPTFVHQLR